MKSTIYLADPHGSGHHYRYLHAIAKAFLNLDCRVHVLCKDKEDFLDQVATSSNGKLVHSSNVYSLGITASTLHLPMGRFDTLLNRFMLWQQTFRRINSVEKQTGEPADLVFLPWLDSYIKNYYNNLKLNRYLPFLLKAVVHRPWSGIYFHPRYLRLPSKYPLIKDDAVSRSRLFNQTGCRAVFTLDEGVKDRLAADIAPTNLYWLPDVLPSDQTNMNWKPLKMLRQKTGKRNQPIILLTGVLNRYKGIVDFIELADRCQNKPWLFVMAGKLDKQSFEPKVRERIHHAKEKLPNLHTIFERIPTEQHINALLSLSSVIYCCYPEFTHSSSMQLRGVQFGKKLIVVNDYLMKGRCQKLPGCHHFAHADSISAASLQAIISGSNKTKSKTTVDFLDQFSFTNFTRQLAKCLH